MVSDSLVEQQVIPSKAGCGFMGQVAVGNDRPVCPMALGSGFSWLDNHEFIALVNLEIYRKRPNRLLVPARPQKLTRIDDHQGSSDALRQ